MLRYHKTYKTLRRQRTNKLEYIAVFLLWIAAIIISGLGGS